MLTKLTTAHRLFVEKYDGTNPAEAFRYSGSNGTDAFCLYSANQLLKDPLIIKAIEEASKYTGKQNAAIASRDERKMFWSSLMRNEDPYHKDAINPLTNAPLPREPLPLAVRIKGSELLGKSETDFVEKIDMTVQHSLSDLIMDSLKAPQGEDDLSIEEIERLHLEAKQQKRLPDIDVTPSPSVIQTEDFY